MLLGQVQGQGYITTNSQSVSQYVLVFSPISVISQKTIIIALIFLGTEKKLKVKATCSSETLIMYRNTPLHIPEKSSLPYFRLLGFLSMTKIYIYKEFL
jgi:hypothetical protein